MKKIDLFKNSKLFAKQRELQLNRFLTKNEIRKLKRKRYITYSIVLFIYLINATCNVIFYNGKLAGLYMASIICFLVGMFFVRHSKDYLLADSIISLTLVFSFCYFLLQYRLVGYDILWIFSIPILWLYIVDFRVAFVTNIILSIFFFTIFYTEFSSGFFGTYANEFMLRFPVSFVLVFIVSVIVYIRSKTTEIMSELNAYYDTLSGLSNRAYYKRVVDYLRKRGLTDINMIVASLDVNGLKKINDNYGHEKGDLLIKGASSAIKRAFKNAKLVSRMGGDEFAIITYESEESFEESCRNLVKYCSEYHDDVIDKITISIGYAKSKDFPYINPNKLYAIADKMMYDNKANYYSQNNIDRRAR